MFLASELKHPDYINTDYRIQAGQTRTQPELRPEWKETNKIQTGLIQDPKQELPRTSLQIQDANKSQPVANLNLTRTQAESNKNSTRNQPGPIKIPTRN